jgi:hypothetical protein
LEILLFVDDLVLVSKLALPVGLSHNRSHRGTARLPAQMRLCLPLYLAGVVLFFIAANFTLPHHQYEIFERPLPPPKVPIALRSEFPQKIWQTWKVRILHKLHGRLHRQHLRNCFENIVWTILCGLYCTDYIL